MTPVLCCGAECGTSGAHWTLGLNASFSTGTVNPGGGVRSLRINPSAATGSAQLIASQSVNTVVYRFYVRFATLPSASCSIGYCTGTGDGVIFKASDGKLYAGANNAGTLGFGATGVAVTTGQWYRIDISIN